VSANLGTKVNRRKRAVRLDPNVMKNIGTEWSDKGDGVVVKVNDARKKTEEVALNKFFRWNPEFLTVVINNLILVWVAVDSKGASGGSEEIGEEIG